MNSYTIYFTFSKRLKKWHPELTETVLDELTSEMQNQLWLDPFEYRNIKVT